MENEEEEGKGKERDWKSGREEKMGVIEKREV